MSVADPIIGPNPNGQRACADSKKRMAHHHQHVRAITVESFRVSIIRTLKLLLLPYNTGRAGARILIVGLC